MLGRFLEFSVVTPDIRASLDFYDKLGFAQANVGEAWAHPYAVLTDGRICLGLHQDPAFSPSMTFVKPDLLKHLGGLEPLVAKLEFRRLAGDTFNEIGWLDPSGHMIRLVEARTFSPAARVGGDSTLCGYFLQIALPTPHRGIAKSYWEQLGFVGLDQSDDALPHVSCTSDTIEIGLFEPAFLREPTLLFEVKDLTETLGRLEAIGISVDRVPQIPGRMPVALLRAPEGTAILMSEARNT